MPEEARKYSQTRVDGRNSSKLVPRGVRRVMCIWVCGVTFGVVCTLTVVLTSWLTEIYKDA
ncbi:hypothetical protein NEOLEDRAFT_1140200 [Neolentinus lepideus HHB14362 ss-1]|uniref:Uncharacterized protein n=1 Tax=Neolentinus lepideus HHB14362 ss-1 TaxID=1314782 RepID=A0A165PDA0_9AGAM|nr:hypothetical protein NEOLEDRAFT_1140200 [Neolentinus lepideus HHB14362 ss-1]